MNIINNYFEQSELALAAYSELYKGISSDEYIRSLQNGGKGMSQVQAEVFAKKWRVLDQYNDSTGLSATVFENIADGKRYLAIRGTELTDPNDIATDLIDIGDLGTAEHQAQYAALSVQVQKWLNEGTLQPSFTVSGHSLGGFLATNLALDYSADVSHTYLYNAPGVTGVGGNLLAAIVNALSPGNPITIPPVTSISNIVAKGDVVSSVGLSVAPPTVLTVEAQSPLGAHSISSLTDALAVYNLYASIDPSISVNTISNILAVSSNQSNNTLEAAVSAVGELVVPGFSVRQGNIYDNNRDLLYTDLQSITGALPDSSSLTIAAFGTTNSTDGTFTPFSPSQIETLARNDIAYRYALVQGNAFAVLNADYSQFDTNGELDIYNPATGEGKLTNMYLADRSEMLAWKIQVAMADADASETDPYTGSNAPDVTFRDVTSGQSLYLGNLPLGLDVDRQRILFGGTGADNLVGDSKNDHLYGMDGRDTLMGYDGDDYLEGDAGDDILKGGAGNDTYMYKPGDGADTITDTETSSTGSNHILVGSFELSDAQVKTTYVDPSRGFYAFTDTTNGLVFEWDKAKQTLLIMGSALDDGNETLSGENSITVNDISDLSQVKDRFGIDLELPLKATVTDSATNPYTDPDYTASDLVSTIGENTSKLFHLALNQALKAGDTITLTVDSISGMARDLLKLVTGDQVLSFESGSVTLNASEGQNFLSLALLEQGDIPADASVVLTATVHSTAADGTDVTANSNNFTLNITDNGIATSTPTQPNTTRDIVGDFAPMDFYDADGNVVHHSDELGNLVTDPSRPETRDDTLNDSAGNDHITSGGGDDTINLMRGGDDIVDAGDGNDTVYKTAVGSDVINLGAGDDNLFTSTDSTNDTLSVDGGGGRDMLGGGEGQDILEGGAGADNLYGAGGNDRLFGDEQSDVSDFIAQGATQAGTGKQGDLLVAGAGNDQVLGGAGNDLVAGGDGDDFIATGGGDDFIWGDKNIGAFADQWKDWSITENVTTDADGRTNYNYGLNNLFSSDATEAGNDTIYAGAGDDMVSGEGGDDTLYLEAGNDKAWGGAGSDTILGGAGDDLINGDNSLNILAESQHGDDFLDGGDGNDEIYGGGGSDTLYGGSGDDLLVGDDNDQQTGGNDYLNGEDGNDTLAGGGGMDTLLGGDGDDKLYGEDSGTPVAQQAADYLDGGAGNDLLVGGGGGDMLLGGDGDDQLYGELADTPESAQGDDYLDGGAGNDVLDGGGGADTLLGGDGDDQLYGEDSSTPESVHGNDYLDGGAGNDLLAGGGGADTLIGGDGDDQLYGEDSSTPESVQGNDYLDGGAGKDVLSGGGGADTLLGGDDNDQLYGDYSDTPDALQGDDYLDGGDGDDLLVGAGGSDTLIGGDGDDTLDGDGSGLAESLYGNDYLDGGAGNDTLIGNGGADTLFGGEGNDVLSGDAADVPLSVQGDDYLDGGAGNDHLEGMGGNDTLLGGTGDDFLGGGDGNDSLDGGDGNDTLMGDAGDDVLSGGAGDDTLIAGQGNDIVDGGDGDDTYIYARGDGTLTITDDGGSNTLRFGAGITTEQISLGLGSLMIRTGEDGDVIHIENFNPDDVFGEVAIDRFEFADGTVWSYQDLIDRGFDLSGTAGNDVIEGTGVVDRLSGLAGDDTLVGKAGNDLLDGGSGADVMQGGTGDDTYIVDDAGDQVIEAAGEGTDEVRSGIDYTLAANVENLTLTGSAVSGTGNDLDNLIIGNDLDNRLEGLAGNDTLEGGAGADTMVGGAGDDLYIVDNAGDQVVEAAGEGTDEVRSAVDYTLAANVENLILTGSAVSGTGNELDNVIVGNDLDNRLEGLAGNDTLIGGAGDDLLDGGIGSDTLSGGAGDDVYIVDDAGDQVIEGSDQGTDRVESSVSYQLAANVEDLTLTGTGDLDGWGNDGDNLLVGNAGDNQLFGGFGNDRLEGGAGDDLLDGGTGSDTLVGGEGNDTFRVDSGSDVVVEQAGQGTDTVESSFTYTLGDNLENLVLTGTGWINGTGNDLENHLIGNSANNVLDGGTGADLLEGGAGNDTYIVDNKGDQVVEAADSGSDRVESSISFTLGANVERLTLTGNDAIDGTGNDLDNIITGNNADNVLSGGEGNDSLMGIGGRNTLYGGSGQDRLYGGSDQDRLYGGAGDDYLDGGIGAADLMVGGQGDDTYYVNNVSDQIVEYAGEGIDQVDSSVSYTLPAEVENLTLGGWDPLSGTGNELDNELWGNRGDNLLIGGGGDDFLDGLYGHDVLKGGEGNDTYRVLSVDAQVVENVDEGYDSVISSLPTYTLTDNVEQLILWSYGEIDHEGIGNALDNSIIGNWLDNQLYGLAGNDEIDGGDGNDAIYGGDGNDILYGGDDDPQYGDWETNNDYLDGGAGDDQLYGGSGDDILNGGTGIDMMTGGSGDDVYYVDDYEQVTSGSGDDGSCGEGGKHDRRKGNEGFGNGEDAPPPGHDCNWNDGPGTSPGEPGRRGGHDERGLAMVFCDNGGDPRKNEDKCGHKGNGPPFDHDCGSICDGGHGHRDNDSGGGTVTTYITDTVTENVDEGYDVVYSSISYGLTANVEELRLTGTDNLGGTGNDLDNLIVGNSGNNELSGGLGSDALQGGEGDDTYLFNTGDGADTVVNDDPTGFDRILFGADVDSSSIALFRDGDNLEVGYGATDQVTVSNFFAGPDSQVDEVQLADGSLLTAADIEAVVQQMSAYAVNEGISLNSLDSVKHDEDLMPLVAGSWHAA